MWQVISELTDTGVTIFLTTQQLDEADRLAGQIAIIDGGRVVAEGTADELKRRIADQRLELTLVDRAEFDQLLARLGRRPNQADPAQLLITVPTDGSAAQIRGLLDELDPTRSAIEKFAVHGATLDDVFLALTAAPQETADV